MFNYFLKRVGFGFLALFILITLIFFLGNALPGYPIEKSPSETTQNFLDRIAADPILGKSVIEQYGLFWKQWFTTGHFGWNFRNADLTVNKQFAEVIPYTLALAGIAFVISVILGVTLGIISAVYRGKIVDTGINILAIFFLSVPSFVIAAFIVFWATSGGVNTKFVIPGSDGYSIDKMIQSAVFPILCLVISLTPTIVYYTRNEMVEVLSQDYIKTALSKGMSYASVVIKHGIRNAMIPIVSIIVPTFLVVISGSLIIERFFSVPGISNQLVEAVNTKHIYLLMYNALVVSGIFFLLEILADMSYVLIDPRIRLAQSNNLSLTKKMYFSFKRWHNERFIEKLVEKNNYIELNEEDSLSNEIKELELASYRKKKVYLSSDLINKYNINLVEKQYIVLNNNILKIKTEQNSGKE